VRGASVDIGAVRLKKRQLASVFHHGDFSIAQTVEAVDDLIDQPVGNSDAAVEVRGGFCVVEERAEARRIGLRVRKANVQDAVTQAVDFGCIVAVPAEPVASTVKGLEPVLYEPGLKIRATGERADTDRIGLDKSPLVLVVVGEALVRIGVVRGRRGDDDVLVSPFPIDLSHEVVGVKIVRLLGRC
jgi:hypothetical protein